MKVIGFGLTKILVEKKEKLPKSVKVDQNIDIKEVVEEKLNISNQDSIKIHFQFSLNYSEEYAKLIYEGFVITLPTKEEKDELLKDWKNNKIPETVRIPLFNFIMNKCNVRAMSIEDDLGIPLHVPLPRLSNERK